MALTDLTRISTSGIATGSTIDAPILRKDVSFRGTQVGVTSALFDSSDDALEFNDNVKLKFGNDGDLEVYHNGADSYIDVKTGSLYFRNTFPTNTIFQTGNFTIKNQSNNQTVAIFAPGANGGGKLYHENDLKFQTTQTGAVVTGILTATSFSGPVVGNTNNTSGISTFYDLRVSNNLTVEGTTTTLDTNLIGVDRVEVGADSNTIVGVAVTQSGTADLVNLFDGATKVLTVDDQGNVGINSTTPYEKLDVVGNVDIKGGTNGLRITSSAPGVKFTDSDAPGGYGFIGVNNTSGSLVMRSDDQNALASSYMGFEIDGVQRVGIASDGDVTITGYDNAELKLKSGNANADGYLAFINNAGITSGRIAYDHQYDKMTFNVGGTGTGTEKLRIQSDGNVLVGTTDTTIYNNGDSSSEGIVLRGGEVIDIARKGDLQLTLNRQTNDGPHIAFYRSGGVKSYISTRDSALCFDVNSTTERLRITSDGYFHMGGGNSWTYASQKFVVVEPNNNLGMLLQGNNANEGVNLTLQNIVNANNAYSSLSFADDGGQIFGVVRGKVKDKNANTGELQFWTSSSQRLTINKDGEVGIGTDNPSGKLNIVGTDSQIFNIVQDTGDLAIRLNDRYSSSTYIKIPDGSGAFTVETGGSESIRINGSGYVGIGTDNPIDILDINSDQPSAVSDVYIRNHANLGGAALNLFTQGTYSSPTYKAIVGCSDAGGNIRMGAASNHDLLLLTNNDAKITIKSTGNVGINTNNPTNVFESHALGNDSDNYQQIAFERKTSANSKQAFGLVIRSNAQTSSGNEPTAYLRFDARPSSLNGSHGGNAIIAFSPIGVTQGTYGKGNLDFYLRSGGTYTFLNDPGGAGEMQPKLRIEPGGDVKINTGDIYFGTAGKGIVLGATSNQDAHTLDHYQEGTSALTVKCGSVSVPLLNNTCKWTRIGNTLHLSAWIRVSGGQDASALTLSDPIKITGFPFTTVGNSTGRTRLVFTGYSFYNVTNATALWGWMVVQDGATSTEHELHWGNANWSGLVAPTGNNITSGGNYTSSEIYLNGHMFV